MTSTLRKWHERSKSAGKLYPTQVFWCRYMWLYAAIKSIYALFTVQGLSGKITGVLSMSLIGVIMAVALSWSLREHDTTVHGHMLRAAALYAAVCLVAIGLSIAMYAKDRQIAYMAALEVFSTCFGIFIVVFVIGILYRLTAKPKNDANKDREP